MHKRRYPPADPGGAIKVSGKVSGRYNRGLDQFSEDESFGALYLATRGRRSASARSTVTSPPTSYLRSTTTA
jgi:hypothetical protein